MNKIENLMNVEIEKVLSAQVKVKGNDSVYHVETNVTFNENKEITNVDGQVYRISDNVQVANFNKYMGNSLNVNYQVAGKEEQCAITGVINDCLDKSIESAGVQPVTL